MLRRAARRGMIPILNAMIAVGVISVPGMMTGQLLAGEDPGTAARYQLFILFAIAGAVALGTSMRPATSAAGRARQGRAAVSCERVLVRVAGGLTKFILSIVQAYVPGPQHLGAAPRVPRKISTADDAAGGACGLPNRRFGPCRALWRGCVLQ